MEPESPPRAGASLCSLSRVSCHPGLCRLFMHHPLPLMERLSINLQGWQFFFVCSKEIPCASALVNNATFLRSRTHWECRPHKCNIYSVDPYLSLTCGFHIFRKPCWENRPHKVCDKTLIVKKLDDPRGFLTVLHHCFYLFYFSLLAQVGNICNARDVSVPPLRTLLSDGSRKSEKNKATAKSVLRNDDARPPPNLHQQNDSYGRP